MADEATKVFDEQSIVLSSGKELHLTPLSIKNLRKFMRIWGEQMDFLRSVSDMEEADQPSSADFGDKQFEVYIQLLELSLEKPLAEYDEKNETKTNVKEFIEDEVDEKSMYLILKMTGGLDLDP